MVCFLLIAISLLKTTEATVYYVIPDDNYSTNDNTNVLQYYLNNSMKYFTSNTQLKFLPGQYFLNKMLTINNVSNFSLLGDSTGGAIKTIITCTSPGGIIVVSSSNITISKVVMYECSSNHSFLNDLHYNKDKDFASLFVSNSTHVTCTYFTSFCYQNICGIKFINSFGNTALSNLISHYLIILYYGNNNHMMSNITHRLYIENFTYHTDNKRIYALEIQQCNASYNLNIVITQLHMADSQVLLIICNVCSGQREIVISNSSFVGDLDNRSMDEYYNDNSTLYDDPTPVVSIDDYDDDDDKDDPFDVYEVDSILYYQHTGFKEQHVKNIVQVINCQFVNISKAYVILAFNLENDYTEFLSIYIKNCVFHNNRDTLILFANHDIHKHYYQHCMSVLVTDVTISYNVYKSQQIIYGNSVKMIFEKAIIASNIVYPLFTCLFFKMSYSILQFNDYNEFSENSLTYLTDSPAIYVQENAVLNISLNVLQYPFFYPAFTYNYLVELCTVQYISERGNLDNEFQMGQKINYTIMYIENDISLQFPRTWMHCAWDPTSAFLASVPLNVNQKFIHYEPPLTIIKPKHICLCNENKTHNCQSETIGSFYPGEMVSTTFIYVDDDDSYVERTISLFKYNTEHHSNFECRSDGIVVFHQSSNKCTTVNYRIVHSNEHWCALILKEDSRDLKNSAQVYTVMLRPCPVGFTLHLEGVCQCDPILSSHIPSLTNCNIDKQTIPRPANSWITADTVNGSHYYNVSLQCPQDYCLPHSSHLNLTTPDSQCQHNRSGKLCGKCPKTFSTIFGSFKCKQCSNISLLIIIPIGIAGLVLVVLLFTLNLTVTDGDINSFLFYANIISINTHIFFPTDRSVMYTFISLANLDLGIETCFYNGMDDYAKMWLQLAFPVYLIFIALSLTIASRYSIAIQKITASGVLPVLATLFLLSYTKVLLAVSNVLFFYTTITHLPSNTTTLLWYVDANIPLFGVKFTFLFTICLILFLILIPFNILLIFTRTLSCFKTVNHFKPLLDAYLGPYKDKYYCWTGIQLLIRAIFFGLSALDKNANLKVCISILVVMMWLHELILPFKSNRANMLDLLNLLNLLVVFVTSLYTTSNYIVVNISVAIAIFQLVCIALHHIKINIYKLTCFDLAKVTGKISNFLANHLHNGKQSNRNNQQRAIELVNAVPDVDFNYKEFQEPLIGQDT